LCAVRACLCVSPAGLAKMGVGNIFVATTLAPLVIVLASVSLQLLTIGLEQLGKYASHSNSKSPLYPFIRKAHFILNTQCFGDMEIDVKSFSNVLMVAVIMALVGVALSLGSIEDATLAARAA
ncbi:unnamed protein product, partial [Ectocarpus sp. 4 AP-2014]